MQQQRRRRQRQQRRGHTHIGQRPTGLPKSRTDRRRRPVGRGRAGRAPRTPPRQESLSHGENASIRHHTAYIDETRTADLTPGWLRIDTDIRPPMSFRTDFDRKFEKLTKGYHSQTLELVKHNYRQVQDQLGSELGTTVTHIATVIDGETNAQTKTERATMVRDHATRMKRLEAEKRRNGKRCREAKMNDRKRPRSVSKPFSASSAASSKSKRKQKNRRHSYQPMTTLVLTVGRGKESSTASRRCTFRLGGTGDD